MNYETFRSLWSQALEACDLKLFEHTVQETLNPVSLKRSYRALVGHLKENSAPPPFSVLAELTWNWDALLTACFETTEEDVLTELFGRKRRPKNTQAPWLRLDVRLLLDDWPDGADFLGCRLAAVRPFPVGNHWPIWA